MNKNRGPTRRTPQSPAPREAGFSLIELLVSMAIGLILTLAITSVMIRTEGSKRSSTSVNDINQSGAYAAFLLDRVIRSAGSGFSQGWSNVYGCLLDVSQGNTRILPVPAAGIPASSAFRNVPLNVRLAPVIIGKGFADASATDVRGDVLIVMGGTAGVGESPQTANTGSVTATGVRLPNTLGYQNGDLVLLSDPNTSSSCLLQQVKFATAAPTGASLPTGASWPTGSTDQALPFSQTSADGTYPGGGGTNITLAGFSAGNPIVFQLGRDTTNPANTNPPQFKAFGVGPNLTLMSYDLLQPLPAAPAVPDVALTDGVVEMRAIYGLDTDPPTGKLTSWVDATGSYAASALSDGSAGAAKNLRRIVAVRVGLILRTSLQERSPSTSASSVLSPETYGQAANTKLILFSDLPTLQQTRTLGAGELNYRFRTVETTIPLRNVLLAP